MTRKTLFAIGALLTGAFATDQSGAQTPASPPSTVASQSGARMLENEFVALDVKVAGNTFAEAVFTDKINGKNYNLGPDLFTIGLAVGDNEESVQEGRGKTPEGPRDTIQRRVAARDLIAGEVVEEVIPARADARRLVDRRAGKRVTIPFSIGNDGLGVKWIAEMREGLPYVRISLEITSVQGPQPVREIRVLDFAAPDGMVQGSVKGSPVTASGNRIFAGVESPLSSNEARDGRVIARLNRQLDIPSRSPFTVSAVLGASNPGQLRRTFQLSYLNEERARPYGAFLNYNTWYDIGFFNKYDEKDALNVVNLYGEELVKKRGVVVDSFLFDDGWDNSETLWQFHAGFPQELKNVRKAAESYGASPGIWFSPCGGYGQPKANRLKAAAGKFDLNDIGFALAGPKYFDHFRNMCMHMIKENGVNHFKLDGTSGTDTQIPGSKFSSDFEAIIQIINDLRDVRPDLYINLTSGTWSSPFWFGIADSIWRGGYDHEFLGEGTSRNRWITFRDARIYDNNVEISPLFPINSLMTHGVIYTKRARDLDKVEGDDLTNEIWSGFGSGTQMQEIYVSPGLLKKAEWDTLAAAAKWARANNETLVDTHWIGGSPSNMEVYGWASWSPAKGIVTLRNPSSRTQTWSFDPAAVFELPAGAPSTYTLTSPKGDKLPVEKVEAGKSATLTLAPFQVIVLEALPVTK